MPESSRLAFLQKFLANNFALSDAEDNTSGPLNRVDIADLTLLRKALCRKSREPRFLEVMDSNFISIGKFGNLKSTFATVVSLSELYFRFRRFFLLVQTKKRSLWTMAAAQAAKNHEEEWGSTWYYGEEYIHEFQPDLPKKFTSSNRSTEFKNILPWNISQMITKTVPISTRIVISYAIPVLSLTESQWKLRQPHYQTLPMEGKPL